MKHAVTHTWLRYFSFLGDVCLLSLPGQVQLKKLLVSHKVCTLLSKFIISMHFWSIYSRCYCSSGSFTKGLIPPYHATPSNCRNVRCTWACTGVKNKWGRRAFSFPSSFFFVQILQFLCLCLLLIRTLPSLLPLLYNDLENLLPPKKSFHHASTVPSLQKLWGNKDLTI